MTRLVIVFAMLICAGTTSAESPQVNYLLQCQGCHLGDGAGTPGKVPALDGEVARFLTVPGGREYLVQVPGSAQSPLDDAALAELLNWMMARFGPTEAAASALPFTADEVGRLRQRPLTDVVAARRRLIEAMDASR